MWDNDAEMQTQDGPGGYDSPVPAKIAPWVTDALRRERGSKGWTQAELARRASVDRSHLNDLEAERRYANLETIEKLCRALKLPISAVFAQAERLYAESPVAVAYIVRGGRLLMVQRRDPDWIPEWGAPAGTARPGERPADAAEREVREEVGLTVAVEDYLGGRFHPASNRTLEYFACRIVSGEVALGDELAAWEWCDWPTVQERWAGIKGGIYPAVREHLEGMGGKG
jgi:8-oxo-dGTP diphosphatase